MVAQAKGDRDGSAQPSGPGCLEPPKRIRRGYPIMPGVAHELGNLLSVISSWVQDWEQTGRDAAEVDLASRGVNAGLGRLRYSLNRLASPAFHSQGHLAVVDVNSLLKHSLSTLCPSLVHSHRLTKLSEPEPWPVVGDFCALDLVLVSLVMNAVALSPAGSPIFVKSNNVEAESPIHGIDGFLAEGAYVSLSVHHYQDEAGKDPDPHCIRENLPLCLHILAEHGGLLQSTSSPRGESRAAMFLPAVARCLPAESLGSAPPEEGAR